MSCRAVPCFASVNTVLVAFDAFHAVSENTPRPAAGVLPPTAADLPPVIPVLDDTVPGVTPVLDDTPSPADDLPPAAERSVP